MSLSQILWIGGATDTGKSTVAQRIGEIYDLPVYHYDHYDLVHHQELAQDDPTIQAFLQASLDERWVQQTPETLLKRSLASFQKRFPLVVHDLQALSTGKWVLAEGFGFTPELLVPHLTDKQQAIWMIPTPEFKRASVERRDKPSWRFQTSDPARAKANLVTRDLLLAEYYERETEHYGVRCIMVDGSQSIEKMVELVQAQFAPFLG